MHRPRIVVPRRGFLRYSALGLAGVSLAPLAIAQPSSERPDPIAPELVKEFVIKGHGDFKKTEEMLNEHPDLLNVSWDWGGGDYEMAVEGAGHVGNKEIAGFLLTKGARVTLFVVAMLGRIDIVKPVLTAFPEQIHAQGPHGLGLLHHAKNGGEQAKEVLRYLQSVGAS